MIFAGITRDYSDFANKNGVTAIPDPAGRRNFWGYLGLFEGRKISVRDCPLDYLWLYLGGEGKVAQIRHC